MNTGAIGFYDALLSAEFNFKPWTRAIPPEVLSVRTHAEKQLHPSPAESPGLLVRFVSQLPCFRS
jgi:hypothetical protein